jgi:hypothetical protein
MPGKPPQKDQVWRAEVEVTGLRDVAEHREFWEALKGLVKKNRARVRFLGRRPKPRRKKTR